MEQDSDIFDTQFSVQGSEKMDEWTIKWLNAMNEQFYLMEEYQGQAEPFQGEDEMLLEELLEFWKYFMLAFQSKMDNIIEEKME